ncbi:MAG TPA: DUF5317 family protein [Anaerolineales bacterium]
MILLYAVLAGLLAGLVRARLTRRSLRFPGLRLLWLAPAAYLPQHLAFQFSPARRLLPDDLAAFILVGTQLLLLAFVWANRQQPGFWLLGLGLVLNLLVIALNGGFMPISPETVARLAPDAPPGTWQVGERLGSTKDIVLPAADIRFEWLSDRFLMTAGTSANRVAFSIGDVIIALGAFRLLWMLGSPGPGRTSESFQSPESRFSLGSLHSNREREYGD